MRSVQVETVPVLICKARGCLYAYRNACPACNQPLSAGALADEILTCPAGHRFDVHHAGFGCDGLDMHLDPLPLLTQANVVKVAVK